MSWQHQHRTHHGQLPKAPEDGIATSSHPPGWLGKRWRALLEQAPGEARDRVLRGRNFAKRGRARQLEISPGSATAEVVAEEDFHPTVRVRTFAGREWATLVATLLEQLDRIASLLEAELPASLVAVLEKRGVAIVPTWDELTFDCDCGDYVMPCTHVSTVFHVLVDALDADPFLLLTLRGRSRDHLLSTLRAQWGDDAPVRVVAAHVEEPPPGGDWSASPDPLPDLGVRYEPPQHAAAGLRALGPPPGEQDLITTLRPLYASGGEAALALVEALPDRPVPERRPRATPRPPEPPAAAPAPPRAAADAPPPSAPLPASEPADPHTAGVLALLGSEAPVTTEHIADTLDLRLSDAKYALARLLRDGRLAAGPPAPDGAKTWILR